MKVSEQIRLSRVKHSNMRQAIKRLLHAATRNHWSIGRPNAKIRDGINPSERRMIKQSILLSFLIAGLALAQTETPPPYRIEVTIDGFEGGQCKFIGIYGDQSFMALPAFTVAGPGIVVTKDEAFPGGLYSLVLPGGQGLQILLDTDQQFSIHTTLDDLTGAAKITGSLDNKLFYENLIYEISYQKSVDPLIDEINELKKTDAMADVSALEAKRDELVAKRRVHIQQFCAQHPESFFSAYKLSGQNPPLEYPKLANGDIDVVIN